MSLKGYKYSLAAKHLISEAMPMQSLAQSVSAVWHIQKWMHVLKTLAGHELWPESILIV